VRQSEAMSRSKLGWCGHIRHGVSSLLIAFCACSSSDDDGLATAAPAPGSPEVGETPGLGAEPDATTTDENAAGDPSMASEAQDPNTIANVEPGPLPAAPPAPSSGCGQLTLLASGEQSLEVDGVLRTYLLDVPAGYDGTTPYPLVFAFHGATTSGEFFRSAFYGNLLSAMADEAVVVHPDALGSPSAWNEAADVPFFDAMLASLESSACIDDTRVFATGHSSGGFFTNTLGCQRGDALRAIAPVSAGGPFTFGRPGGASACTGEVAVWIAHAENDETVAFENGVASRDRWLEANGCGDTTAPAEPAPCVEYTGCSEGLPVRWCVYDDGHDWPEFGPDGIWGFFRAL
jgi:poly(3-hydroxybutyrate) depolymerase